MDPEPDILEIRGFTNGLDFPVENGTGDQA
jgi:hypothetical protein